MVKVFKFLAILIGILLILVGLAHIAAVLKYYFVWLVVGCLACAAAYFWLKDKSSKSN